MNPSIALQVMALNIAEPLPKAKTGPGKPEDWKKSNGDVELPAETQRKELSNVQGKKWDIKNEAGDLAAHGLLTEALLGGGKTLNVLLLAVDQPGAELKFSKEKSTRVSGATIKEHAFPPAPVILVQQHLQGGKLCFRDAVFTKEDPLEVGVKAGSSLIEFGEKSDYVSVGIDARSTPEYSEKDKTITPAHRVKIPVSQLKDISVTLKKEDSEKEDADVSGELTASNVEVSVINKGKGSLDFRRLDVTFDIFDIVDGKEKALKSVNFYKDGEMVDEPDKIKKALEDIAEDAKKKAPEAVREVPPPPRLAPPEQKKEGVGR